MGYIKHPPGTQLTAKQRHTVNAIWNVVPLSFLMYHGITDKPTTAEKAEELCEVAHVYFVGLAHAEAEKHLQKLERAS